MRVKSLKRADCGLNDIFDKIKTLYYSFDYFYYSFDSAYDSTHLLQNRIRGSTTYGAAFILFVCLKCHLFVRRPVGSGRPTSAP